MRKGNVAGWFVLSIALLLCFAPLWAAAEEGENEGEATPTPEPTPAPTPAPTPEPPPDMPLEATPEPGGPRGRDYQMNDVVVTGTRTPHAVSDAPVATSVVTAQDIASAGVEDAGDALRSVPGVYVDEYEFASRGGPGTGINLHGLPSDRILVLVDGQRMPWTMRAPDLELIPATLIQRIEVVKGPSSSLYGSDAEAGVVNIITRQPSERLNAELLLSGGSYNTYGGNVFNSYTAGPVGWVFNFNREQSEGWIDHYANRSIVEIGEGVVETLNVPNNPGHPYETNDVFGKMVFQLSPVVRLRAQSDYHWENNHFSDEDDGAVRDDKVRLSGMLRGELEYGAISAALMGSYYHRYFRYREYSTAYVNNPLPPPDLVRSHVNKGNDTTGDDFGGELVVSGALADWNLLTGGLSYRYEMLEYSAFEQSVMTDADQAYNAYQTILSAYVQDEIYLFNQIWSLVPGVRVDYHDAWGTVVNPKFSTLVKPTDSTALRASIGRAFREPTLSQLYRPVFRHSGYYMTGNEELQPESAIGWDAEIEQTIGSVVRATVGYFQYELDDMIWTTIIQEDYQGGLPLMTYTNLKRARTYGLESSLELFAGRYVRSRWNYTWTRTRDLDEDDILGTVPEHSAGAQLFVDYDPWGLGGFVGANYESEREYIGMGGLWYTAGPMWLTSARVYKTLGSHVEIAGLVKNWLGYRWDREDDGDADIPPTSYYGELKLSY